MEIASSMPTGGQRKIKIRLSVRKNTAFASRQQQRKQVLGAAAFNIIMTRLFVDFQSALF
jgi:hypothetical protein